MLRVLERQPIGPLWLAVASLDVAADWVIAAATRSTRVQIHLANAHTISLADREPSYLATVAPAVAFVDGRPIAWASALLRQQPRLHQVRGPSLMAEVCDRGRTVGLRHYLLGSRPEVLARLRAKLESRYPGIEIVGVLSPPFRDATAEELAHRDREIAASGAQIVWVGLGTPKQDVEANRLVNSLPVTAIAIGAAFDFLAGEAKQAPGWMSRSGLEWLYRLSQEPRRLWRRYLFGNPQFVVTVLRRRR